MCTIVKQKLRVKTKYGYKVVIDTNEPSITTSVQSYFNGFLWLPDKVNTALYYPSTPNHPKLTIRLTEVIFTLLPN